MHQVKTSRQGRPQPALLVLADGTRWPGTAFGALGDRTGEVVFNTSMTGYQEVLTDPSYHGQIVVMSQPHIGNYGVAADDDESARAWVAGFVVRAASPLASNWRAAATLDEYLAERGVAGMTEVDTRALVRHIRTHGAQNAALSNTDPDPERLLALARAAPDMNGLDLAREVTCAERYHYAGLPPDPSPDDEEQERRQDTGLTPDPSPDDEKQERRQERGVIELELPLGMMADGRRPTGASLQVSASGPSRRPEAALEIVREPPRFHVVAYDYGLKRNILRLLGAHGCRVTVVPAMTPAEDVLALAPDGVFLSNGPGDPAAVTYAVSGVRQMLGRVPIFGICLGHQILGLALGGDTYKLKFGHRGGNQPVKHLPTGRVEISSHNHGFAVRAESLPAGVEVTHLNLNDGCVEGLAAPALRAFSVQYHPEAAPGPHDSRYLFEEFARLMAAQSTALGG